MRVFVVWEPVLPTDWASPGASLTGYVPDFRASHYYDHDRHLSAALGGTDALDRLSKGSQIGFRMKDVIWDAALVYPPGVRFGEQASLLVAPVIKFQAKILDALSAPVR